MDIATTVASTATACDVYIAKLRKHLREDPSVEIINVHGKGFRSIVKEG